MNACGFVNMGLRQTALNGFLLFHCHNTQNLGTAVPW